MLKLPFLALVSTQHQRNLIRRLRYVRHPLGKMLLAGPVPPSSFEDNGCGPKTWLGVLKLLIPNGIRKGLVGRKLDWTLACRYHDYHWNLAAQGTMTYAEADVRLWENMTRMLEDQGCPMRARIYPFLYWLGVRAGALWKLKAWRPTE